MRLRIELYSEKPVKIPFNYNYQLHSAIYKIISQSEPDFAKFLHDTGFKSDNKVFKFFTFSKLFIQAVKSQITKYGFEGINKANFYFCTHIDKIYENFVLGLFAGKEICLQFYNNEVKFFIEKVEVLEDIEFEESMDFICLSPICVSIQVEINNRLQKHFLDYMIPDERERFIQNIYNNLINKFEVISGEKWTKPQNFSFSFNPDYIVKQNGVISKLLKFKDNKKIKCFEAPFKIKTYPELIKLGYSCGFGENNAAGLGCVEEIKNKKSS